MSPFPDTFTRDQHPDRSLPRQSAATPDTDFVVALPSAAARSLLRSHPADRPNGRTNPPFNIKERWDGKLMSDGRWSDSESASHAKFYQNRGKYGTPPQTAMRGCASSPYAEAISRPLVFGEESEQRPDGGSEKFRENIENHKNTTL